MDAVKSIQMAESLLAEGHGGGDMVSEGTMSGKSDLSCRYAQNRWRFALITQLGLL